MSCIKPNIPIRAFEIQWTIDANLLIIRWGYSLAAIIFGIDPGSLRTGYGVIRLKGDQMEYLDHGIIKLPAQGSFASRLAKLNRELTMLYQKFNPHISVIEKVFLGKNADSAFKLGHARGVSMSVAAQFETEVVEYSARYVKKAVTGSGAASKEQVQMLVLNLLRLKTKNETLFDATDALSLAICHARVYEVNKKMKEFLERSM